MWDTLVARWAGAEGRLDTNVDTGTPPRKEDVTVALMKMIRQQG